MKVVKLKIYLKDSGREKIEMEIERGKKKKEKREKEKKREWKREKESMLRERGWIEKRIKKSEKRF